MLDHLGLRTKQFDALTAFYEKALAPLGCKKLMAFPGAAGFGRDAPTLWIGESAHPTSSIHLAIKALDRASVDAFYAAAIAAGAKDNGPPGPRDYTPDYYGAFVIDPDGNNLEAVVASAPAQ